MGKKRRVVQSAEEVHRSNVGDKLLNQGKKNFESVYGNKNVGSFDLNEDMTAMESVNMMTNKQVQQNSQIGAKATGVNFTPVEAQPVPEQAPSAASSEDNTEQPSEGPLVELWMQETNGTIPFNQWLEGKKADEREQLSDDPDKRAEQLSEFLSKSHQNAPTPQMIKDWRRIHGGAFMINIEDRIFIYRYLKRQESIQINANPRIGELSEDQIEEDIFKRCLLWPQLDMIQQAGMPAGGISMVVQQVRLRSLYLDPGYVAQITIKM